MIAQFLLEPAADLASALDCHKRDERLTLQFIRPADDRRFGHFRMADKRALDFRRADAMAGDVQHVVNAADDPKITVFILAAAVAREITAWHFAPVNLLVTFRVAPNPRNMNGHGLRMTSLPPEFRGTTLPCSSTTSGTMPKNGSVAEPGLVGVAPGNGVIMMPPVSVCHQVSTIGQRLPPMIFVIPNPRFGIDRFADCAEQAQRTEDHVSSAIPRPIS